MRIKSYIKPGISQGSFPAAGWGSSGSLSSDMGSCWATSLALVCSGKSFLVFIGLLLSEDTFFSGPGKVTKGEDSSSSSLPKGTLAAASVKARTDGSFTIVLSCLSLKLQPSGESFEPEMSSDKCAWLLGALSPPTPKSFKTPLGRRSWECKLRLGEWCNAWCECTFVAPASASASPSAPLKVGVKSSVRWKRETSLHCVRATINCKYDRKETSSQYALLLKNNQ